MSETIQDELWPHFVPLWTDLRSIAPRLLLAGGYGLFLKQQWLLSQSVFNLAGEQRLLQRHHQSQRVKFVLQLVVAHVINQSARLASNTFSYR